MRVSELAETAEAVAATSSRLAKTDALARLLTRAEPDEIPVITGLLLAAPRQGRLGVGRRGIAALDVPHAAEPTLTIADVDHVLEELVGASGSGSAAVRTG
ncbi:MAG TPA: ATP-dependent DNA ligase, partial [Microbacterium sp.]|nr:ATP-dependent DNA ligase [Microbacterium sp.]